MKHQWLMLLIGFALMCLPFLGFPESFDYSVMFLAGTFFFVKSILAIKHHFALEADSLSNREVNNSKSAEIGNDTIPTTNQKV